jgi:hypothetical protein
MAMYVLAYFWPLPVAKKKKFLNIESRRQESFISANILKFICQIQWAA